MVISSIDLMKGKAVQLIQGKKLAIEKENPLDLAKDFNLYGEIAVIDLDAAMNQGSNFETIKSILPFGDCRVGGGIRDVKTAKKYLSLGARKIILGSKCFDNDQINFSFLKELSNEVGKEHIIIAIDSINHEVVTQGWKHFTGLNLFKIVKELEAYSGEFLYTNVEKEGMLAGADIETLKKLKNITKNKITLAGGVHTLDEIQKISDHNADAQLGMAIYTGKINLADAFIQCLDWKKQNNLIPTITQDQNGEILTLAYSNQESLTHLFNEKKTWFYSRSRNKLWKKGETSGNFQEVFTVRADCDRDALVVKVKPLGPACHSGNYSCFGYKNFYLRDLYEVIEKRIKEPQNKSYTTTLTDKRIREKLVEEIHELNRSKSKDEIIKEAADVCYFLITLLAKENITINEVLNELYRRRKQ